MLKKVLVGCTNYYENIWEFCAHCFEKIICMICNLYEMNENVQSV